MSRPRAAIVVTGSELVRGERTDLNGPFFAREALRLGLEPGRITIVGDAPEELESALAEATSSAPVCFVSGGLGPTHDDRTVEMVARIAGVAMRVDSELERQIESVSRMVADRLKRPYADFSAGVTKQASVPEGSVVLGVAGTAPGLVVDTGACVIVVLPGPPGELRRLWPAALQSAPLRTALARTTPPGRRTLRFYGASESAVARALAEAGGDGDGVEVTICAREFEIHVDVVVEPGAESRADTIVAALRAPLERQLFSEDERSVQELVLEECRRRGLTLATAESCTGGLVAARLTSVPGSSDVFLGGLVTYSNASKQTLLGVDPATLATHGAVSAETAAEMAAGAREALGVDVAVAITGIAGPDGGSDDKPVGLVFLHAAGHDGVAERTFDFPGDRDAIRGRAAVGALHLVRALLARTRHEPA